MAENKEHWDLTDKADKDRVGGGPGAADAYSGAGNASGTPDADTGMRAGRAVNKGDLRADRERLFPEDPAPKAPSAEGDARPPGQLSSGGSQSGQAGSGHSEAAPSEGSLKHHGDKFEDQIPRKPLAKETE